MMDQEISFSGPDMFARAEANRHNQQKSFDWDKAAGIIKEELSKDSAISVEAGLQGDWSYTGGCIFRSGQPVKDEYTYLSSSWATPSMIITYSDGEEKELECFETSGKYDSDSKWPIESIKILQP